MIEVSALELIGYLLGTGGVIGFLSTFLFYKYKKTKEKALATQEAKKAENMDISNAKEVIELYRSGMKDLQDLMSTRERELSKKVAEYSAKMTQYEAENKELKNLIKKLQRNQALIQVKLDAITMQSLQDCTNCSFKNDCNKYKTKLYISKNENEIKDENKVNESDILSDQQ